MLVSPGCCTASVGSVHGNIVGMMNTRAQAVLNYQRVHEYLRRVGDVPRAPQVPTGIDPYPWFFSSRLARFIGRFL